MVDATGSSPVFFVSQASSSPGISGFVRLSSGLGGLFFCLKLVLLRPMIGDEGIDAATFRPFRRPTMSCPSSSVSDDTVSRDIKDDHVIGLVLGCFCSSVCIEL